VGEDTAALTVARGLGRAARRWLGEAKREPGAREVCLDGELGNT
jgi:hypothetical protein